MPKNTPYLNIPMKDPATDGQHYFDVELMINDPLEMLDSYAQTTDQDLAAKGLTLVNHEERITDLEKSYFFDLEAYYGNVKTIDDFQDINSWTVVQGTQSTDTANVKLGKQGLRISDTSGTSQFWRSNKNNLTLDLNKLNNGEVSTEEDYIIFPVFIQNVAAIESVRVLFGADATYSDTNRKYMIWYPETHNLVTGWNYLKVKKLAFNTSGTINWSDIKSVQVLWQSKAGYQNAYVSFQLIQLVKKDPLEDKPNPFQKFGQRELNHHFGEWFVGYEFGNLVAKELSGAIASIRSLSSINKYKDCYAEFITTKTGNECIIGGFYGTSQNYVSLKAEGSLFLVGVRVANVDTLHTFTVSGTDFTVNLNRKGNKVEVIVNGRSLLTTTFDYLEGCNLAIGSNNPETSYSKSATITEISHSHHADIAERLAYRNLSLPSIAVGALRKTKVLFVSADFVISTAKHEVIIDLGDSADTGILDITVAAGYNMGIGGNAITKRFHMQEGTNFPSHYRYAGEPAASIFAITDIWVESGRKKVKIVKNDGHSHPAWIILESYGNLSSLENAKITRANASTEPFVKPSMSPTETVITSGFAAGWSGLIRVSKTQENITIVNIETISKTSDISTTIEVIYTLPETLRPTKGTRVKVIGLNSSSGYINNSAIDIIVGADGNIRCGNVGGVTTNVRRVNGVTILTN